jgi:uncharacterized membrane protein
MPKLLKGGFPFNSTSEEIAQNAPIYKRNMMIILGILLIILIVFIVKFGFGRGLLYFVGAILLISIIVALVLYLKNLFFGNTTVYQPPTM